MSTFSITPPPGKPPLMFADLEPFGRSGHLGHAMFQNRDGEIYALYPNCTGDDNDGHSAMGWMEYKVSSDGGETWSEPQKLSESAEFFADGKGHTLFTEKAVVAADGAIVLFALVSDVSTNARWEPFLQPLYALSHDGGKSWEPFQPIGSDRGRVYDAIEDDSTIYALVFVNDATIDYCGKTDEHVYKLYTSTDNGRTFTYRSTLPFNTRERCYGTLCMLDRKRLVAYIYNRDDEFESDYVLSSDGGRTWSEPKQAHMAKRLRNPQMIAFGGEYFMHGRSGSFGTDEEMGHFVLYRSTDGLTWDDGTYLVRRTHGIGAYSNSIRVTPPSNPQRERVYIHSSHAYSVHRTNVVAWWIDQVD